AAVAGDGRRVLSGRDRRGVPRRRRAGAAHSLRARLLRRVPARPGRQPRGGGAHRTRRPRPPRPARPPLCPPPRPAPAPAAQAPPPGLPVRAPAASKRFYTTIAPYAGLELGVDEPDRVQ